MKEIERKFLVPNLDFLANNTYRSFEIHQGYLMELPDRSLRIRIKNNQALLTLKIGKDALIRSEFEYEIPWEEGQDLLKFCPKVLRKIRFAVPHEGHIWEVDIFKDGLEGIVVAEVELETPDQPVELPPWVGEEVTHDPQFLNVNLIKRL